MSDFDDQMAEWRKTLWGTGPCQDSWQVNFTLTDEEREAIRNVLHHIATRADYLQREDYHLRSLLERTK
jgi:hypothetical protein